MGDFYLKAREELAALSAQLRDVLGAMEMGGSLRKMGVLHLAGDHWDSASQQ